MAAAAAARSLSGPVISSFPFLSVEEFEGACRALLHRIHVAGNVQAGWSSVRFQATGPSLKISQNLGSLRPSPHDDTMPRPADSQEMQLDVDEEDPEALIRVPDSCVTLQVDYDILLSPTYQVPVLYFILRQTRQPKPLGIDEVYRYLIPGQYKKEIQSVGIMGGISFGYHPESGTPAFFVHPCNTAEAMRHIVEGQSMRPETYLIIWLGLVGNCVGLHLPSELFATGDIPPIQGID